jgi:gamma-glutamyltranspeptidase/glutathione hydrolase
VLGPLVLQTLNIVDGYDLAGTDRFSMGVYHLILEALKVAFADRDRDYGNLRSARTALVA